MNDDILFKSNSETVLFQGEGIARLGNPLEDKAEWVRRLRCTTGQVHGIATMIERGAGGPSVVQQIITVQAALRQVTGLLVRHHVRACLDECLQNQDVMVREHCLADVICLYQLLGGSLPPVYRKE